MWKTHLKGTVQQRADTHLFEHQEPSVAEELTTLLRYHHRTEVRDATLPAGIAAVASGFWACGCRGLEQLGAITFSFDVHHP
jgi:hypothetical protein